ncbi:MAG: diadenylate cyclase CdaA [Akkermansia sp.]
MQRGAAGRNAAGLPLFALDFPQLGQYDAGMFWEYLRALFEIAVLWFLFYQVYRGVRDSRAASMLVGLVAVLLLGYLVVEWTQAQVLKQLAGLIIGPGTILVILFQPEIRTALAKFGSNKFVRRLLKQQVENQDFIARVCDSVAFLVSKRYGALIAICRTNTLKDYAATGTILQAQYSRELIGTIFMPKTPLHDGAVIVNNEQIVAAAAILPVSNRELKDRSMGLRHRAGIGLAEASDAVVIIVSEETGAVSLAVGNIVQRDINSELLAERLTQLLYSHDTEN